MTKPGQCRFRWTADGTTENPHLWIRLLETTDLHANVLPFDYDTNSGSRPFGLARAATLIRQARAEAGNCLLFDNGDFLQGTPLSDLWVRSGGSRPHPVIATMNRLGYDAAALGNHEFDFGLEHLLDAIAAADFPVVCANAVRRRGRTPLQDETLVPPGLVLLKRVTGSTGSEHMLRIGILGLVPPQIIAWNQVHLDGRLISRGIAEAAKKHVPALRAAGADLVVALAHTGIDSTATGRLAENAALPLAGVPGIDAIFAGHSHQIFPNPGSMGEAADGVDHVTGTIGGVPTVMAGYRGSHLGVLDLCLTGAPGAWRIIAHRAEARPVQPAPDVPPADVDSAVVSLAAPAHAETLRLTGKRLGRTSRAIHSYLSQIGSDLATCVVAEAQRAELARQVGGTPLQGLAILSATAPFKTGGRAGPDHYTDIPAGPLTMRNAADLCPFPNMLCSLRVTGADIADWLERAASCFLRIRTDRGAQPLWNPAFPGHAFDMIFGLSYLVDLDQPARYAHTGEPVNGEARRVRDIRHHERPVMPDDTFLLAVNSYRASGGGFYVRDGHCCSTPFAGHVLVRDAIARFLSRTDPAELAGAPGWSFAPVSRASALIETGPGIRGHHHDLAAFHIRDLGDTEGGFARLELPL